MFDKLFGSRKNPKGFKGQGNKLGTGDAPQSSVAADRAVRLAGTPALPKAAPKPATEPKASAPPPGRKLGFADAEPAITASGATAAAVAASRSGVSDGASAPGSAPLQSSSGSAPRPQEPRHASSGSGGDVQVGAGWGVPTASEEVQAAVAMLRSDEAHGAAAAALLGKVLSNIVCSPTEEKFRKLRLGNKKIQEEVLDVPGGLEFLQAAGFQLVFEDADGFAVFPEGEDVGQLQGALEALSLPQHPSPLPAQQPRLPSPPAPELDWSSVAPAAPQQAAPRAEPGAVAAPVRAAPAAAPAELRPPASPSEPRERQTMVLLPSDPSHVVSDEVFRRTPADVKAAYLAARKKQQLGQVLMTRDYRAKLAAGNTKGAKAPTHAVIRVRLPDGLLLQGEFNAGEQVSQVFEWVSDSLRDPARLYELITPARKPLVTSAGTLRQADLLPSCLLNFRWLEHGGWGATLPALSDALLAHARPSVG